MHVQLRWAQSHADRHTFEISQAELGALKNYNTNVIIVFPDGHEGLKIVQRPLFEGAVSLYESIYSETDQRLNMKGWQARFDPPFENPIT